MTTTIAGIRKQLKKSVQPGDLTARQAEILTYMLVCWSHGYVPTLREIGDEFGISSPNGVRTLLKYISKAGYLTNEERCGFQLTDKALDLVL